VAYDEGLSEDSTPPLWWNDRSVRQTELHACYTGVQSGYLL
jgi:hypothetical protein